MPWSGAVERLCSRVAVAADRAAAQDDRGVGRERLPERPHEPDEESRVAAEGAFDRSGDLPGSRCARAADQLGHRFERSVVAARRSEVADVGGRILGRDGLDGVAEGRFRRRGRRVGPADTAKVDDDDAEKSLIDELLDHLGRRAQALRHPRSSRPGPAGGSDRLGGRLGRVRAVWRVGRLRRGSGVCSRRLGRPGESVGESRPQCRR